MFPPHFPISPPALCSPITSLSPMCFLPPALPEHFPLPSFPLLCLPPPALPVYFPLLSLLLLCFASSSVPFPLLFSFCGSSYSPFLRACSFSHLSTESVGLQTGDSYSITAPPDTNSPSGSHRPRARPRVPRGSPRQQGTVLCAHRPPRTHFSRWSHRPPPPL